MINYYDILGLNSAAGNAEIKSAFRQLAKLYHPDINPEGKEHFSKILKAYETLINPVTRSTYDYKLNYHQHQVSEPENKRSKKKYSFDEKELKRRRYYDEHIKKYAKSTASFNAEVASKKPYNEFKYILFATPLAVILFLLIMNLATPNLAEVETNKSEQKYARIQKPEPAPAKEILDQEGDFKLGDSPYTEHFGKAVYDSSQNRVLTVKNLSGADVVLCLFTKKSFVRCFYIKDYFSADVSQLPEDALQICYCSGNTFDRALHLKETDFIGGFKHNQKYYKSVKAFSLHQANELTLQSGLNKDFEQISEKEFFKKPKSRW